VLDGRGGTEQAGVERGRVFVIIHHLFAFLDDAEDGSAQAIEHYEISRYGTLIAWAEELGHGNVTSPAQKRI
jgi:ferritin-like metal-binding protein YciE